MYGGKDVDFGDGPGGTLWVENIGEAQDVLQEFKGFFEDPKCLKVWHNYGFDRHVMNNEGINCAGFAGDTMHMARLWDSARDKAAGTGGTGYSLESLSVEFFPEDANHVKTSMKSLFGVAKLRKDGSEGLVKELPDIRDLQTNPLTRERWIEYSAKDAVATWWVRERLVEKLKGMRWVVNRQDLGTQFDFYDQYLKDFGELLTEMEKNGIRVDTAGHLKEAEQRAKLDKAGMEKTFLDWASGFCKDIKYINIASTAHMQQLLFGEYKDKKLLNKEKIFKIDKTPEEMAQENSEALESNPYANRTAVQLKETLKERGLRLAGKKSELVMRLKEDDKRVELSTLSLSAIQEKCTARGLDNLGSKEQLIEIYLASELLASSNIVKESDLTNVDENQNGLMPKKYREISVTTMGLTPKDFTPTGMPQVSAAVLKKLAGSNLFGDEKDAVWGEAFKFFGGGDAGKTACKALGALAAVGQIDATISNFLVPLQALVDKESRIHCSLNLNTETGRLSSRRPNLQNQPALEKDQYKIRDAFVAEEGKTLIVADYGQLELRLLAHITNCKSMLDAFASGGCFHSRTAMGMYPHIRQAVESGEVMLEWDYSKGQPTCPLVKDVYGSERRKAKTLNFSIAYGKTAFGLAADWGISKDEAEKTLQMWYNDRPEVKEWQDATRTSAKKNHYVRTLMGRYRMLPHADEKNAAGGHQLRAAINTPIQGSAADVVMMAMIRLWKSPVLQRLGWKLLLQIHDEVILEGPKESKDEAMVEVRSLMENPYDGHGLSKLNVFLDVDAKSADSWYKAK
eukprot:gene22490-28618_t